MFEAAVKLTGEPLIVNAPALGAADFVPLTVGHDLRQSSLPNCTQLPEVFLYQNVLSVVTATTA